MVSVAGTVRMGKGFNTAGHAVDLMDHGPSSIQKAINAIQQFVRIVMPAFAGRERCGIDGGPRNPKRAAQRVQRLARKRGRMLRR